VPPPRSLFDKERRTNWSSPSRRPSTVTVDCGFRLWQFSRKNHTPGTQRLPCNDLPPASASLATPAGGFILCLNNTVRQMKIPVFIAHGPEGALALVGLLISAIGVIFGAIAIVVASRKDRGRGSPTGFINALISLLCSSLLLTVFGFPKAVDDDLSLLALLPVPFGFCGLAMSVFKRKTPNQSPEPTAPSGRGSS
jgi:hypothetical protein